METAAVNRIYNEKGELLIMLRANKPFGWGLVGGSVDEGETPAEACIRETKEEAQIDVVNSTFIGTSLSYNGWETHVFETRLDHTPAVVLNKREHLSFRWVKDDENLGHSGLAFAGNTLDFIALGKPSSIPEALDKMADRMLVGMALEHIQTNNTDDDTTQKIDGTETEKEPESPDLS